MFTTPQLRDLFAAFALAGLLAWSPPGADRQHDPDDAADDAFEFADAMIRRREQDRPTAPAEVPPAPPEAGC